MTNAKVATVLKRVETLVHLFEGLPGLRDKLMEQSRDAEEDMRKAIRGCVDMADVATKFYDSMQAHLSILIQDVQLLKSVKMLTDDPTEDTKKRPAQRPLKKARPSRKAGRA